MVGPSRKPVKRPSDEAVAIRDDADLMEGEDGLLHGDDYKNKRARNNDAVKRSRAKAKAKVCETSERVNNLKAENDELEGKIKILGKELQLLKDMFVAHAGREPFHSRLSQFLAIKGIDGIPLGVYNELAAKKLLNDILSEN